MKQGRNYVRLASLRKQKSFRLRPTPSQGPARGLVVAHSNRGKPGVVGLRGGTLCGGHIRHPPAAASDEGELSTGKARLGRERAVFVQRGVVENQLIVGAHSAIHASIHQRAERMRGEVGNNLQADVADRG